MKNPFNHENLLRRLGAIVLGAVLVLGLAACNPETNGDDPEAMATAGEALETLGETGATEALDAATEASEALGEAANEVEDAMDEAEDEIDDVNLSADCENVFQSAPAGAVTGVDDTLDGAIEACGSVAEIREANEEYDLIDEDVDVWVGQRCEATGMQTPVCEEVMSP